MFPNGGIKPESSDIVLKPRLRTAFFDPFSPVKKSVLCFFCWHYATDGGLLPQSPETILHHVEEKLKKSQQCLWAHGEIEYFIGKELNDRNSEKECVNDVGEDRGYHASAPFVFGQSLRREAITILTRIGVLVKYGHSECGLISATREDPTTWEQHEVR